MKKILSLALIILFGLNVNAAGDTTQIKSSVKCQKCKEHLTTQINYMSGVESVWYDETGEMIYVVFDPNKVTVDSVETTVCKAGYPANGKKPDAKASKQVPDCCRATASKK